MARYYDEWPAYVPVAQRQRNAARQVAKLRKAGRKVSPIEITGRKIATTFWGEAWCRNLEAYSDYANRLPRGRSYVRHGSVVDLKVQQGKVRALVHGTELYTVEITISPLPKKRWKEIKEQCAGQIGTLVELLQGSISKGVMSIVTRPGEGLFPSPREIRLSCSCPDWATMCKHVAASLYGVGARLDQEPSLLFVLRGVDPAEMVADALEQPVPARTQRGRVLESDELSSVFGVDIDMDGLSPPTRPAPKLPPDEPAPKRKKKTSKRASPETPKNTAATKAPKTPARKNTAKKNKAPDKESMAQQFNDILTGAGPGPSKSPGPKRVRSRGR
jgi:uncharacterized Zn finger protein